MFYILKSTYLYRSQGFIIIIIIFLNFEQNKVTNFWKIVERFWKHKDVRRIICHLSVGEIANNCSCSYLKPLSSSAYLSISIFKSLYLNLYHQFRKKKAQVSANETYMNAQPR